jgi:NAD(P)H-hydrate repair Nnr-like enzyme with NAD(P)H-hydrate dehydratase domain
MLMAVPAAMHMGAGLLWAASMFASIVLKTGRQRLLVSDCIT